MSEWKKYSIKFAHENKEYETHIYAKSFHDAYRRLQSLINTAEISGEVIEEFPADFDKKYN